MFVGQLGDALDKRQDEPDEEEVRNSQDPQSLPVKQVEEQFVVPSGCVRKTLRSP